jgi:hypothetical protein
VVWTLELDIVDTCGNSGAGSILSPPRHGVLPCVLHLHKQDRHEVPASGVDCEAYLFLLWQNVRDVDATAQTRPRAGLGAAERRNSPPLPPAGTSGGRGLAVLAESPHSAISTAGCPPAVTNAPPTVRDVSSAMSANTPSHVGSASWRPLPSADHAAPSHRVTCSTCCPPAHVKLPPTMRHPWYTVSAVTWGAPYKDPIYSRLEREAKERGYRD